MAYPTSATTYKLPFDGKIRVSSKCRFILVRWFNTPEARPFIVRRSDNREALVKEFNAGTDYLIDQYTREVTFYFNGFMEAFDSKVGRHLGRTGSHLTRSLRGGQVEV